MTCDNCTCAPPRYTLTAFDVDSCQVDQLVVSGATLDAGVLLLDEALAAAGGGTIEIERV